MRIPEPPGEVTAHGRFGPWRSGNPYQTPVSGRYSLQHADLRSFDGLAGLLESSGSFSGSIERIQVNGEAETPDFTIRAAAHPVDVHTGFDAVVNGRSGDVVLHRVAAHFLNTDVIADGTVAAPFPDASKVASLELGVRGGRIEDLLRLVSSGSPGLNGRVNIQLHVDLPPGDAPFLKRLRLTGEMGVADARFTNVQTQETLDRISRNAADGNLDPASVVSDLKGRISALRGMATLSSVTFHLPGADAQVGGSYDLIAHRVDLHGQVWLDEKLSQTTTGFKSLLAKVIDPLFRKGKHLSVVPVRISGVYGHTTVALDLKHRSRAATP